MLLRSWSIYWYFVFHSRSLFRNWSPFSVSSFRFLWVSANWVCKLLLFLLFSLKVFLCSWITFFRCCTSSSRVWFNVSCANCYFWNSWSIFSSRSWLSLNLSSINLLRYWLSFRVFKFSPIYCLFDYIKFSYSFSNSW